MLAAIAIAAIARAANNQGILSVGFSGGGANTIGSRVKGADLLMVAVTLICLALSFAFILVSFMLIALVDRLSMMPMSLCRVPLCFSATRMRISFSLHFVFRLK